MIDYIINNNPFRILSISASAGRTEIDNAINNMLYIINNGKQVMESEFEICGYGEVDRSEESIMKCKKTLENGGFIHRLFWFDKSEYVKNWNNPLYTRDFLKAIENGPTPSNYDDFLALVLIWSSFLGNPSLWEQIGLAVFKYVCEMKNDDMTNRILSLREGKEINDGEDDRRRFSRYLSSFCDDYHDNAHIQKLYGELFSAEWFQNESGLDNAKGKRYATIAYCQAMIYEKDNPDFFTAGNVLNLEEKLPFVVWQALAFRFLEFNLSSWTYVYDKLLLKYDISYDSNRQVVGKSESKEGKTKKQYLIDEYRKAIATGEIDERITEFEEYIKLTTDDVIIDFDAIFQEEYSETAIDNGWFDNRSYKERYEEACKILNNGHKEQALDLLKQLSKESKLNYVNCKIGDIYRKIDSDKAQVWYWMAAIEGSGRAALSLGMLQEYDGRPDSAAKSYLEAVKLNNGFARKCLMRMCIEGKWKPEDPNLFLSWYEDNARRGVVEAQKNMADIYWYGLGVVADKEKALDLYIKLGRNGNEYCLERLLHLLTSNKVDRKKYEFTIVNALLFNGTKGSAAGLYVCANSFYEMYRNNSADTELKNIAIYFYEISAAKGCKKAKIELAKLEKSGVYKKRSIRHLRHYNGNLERWSASKPIKDRNVTNEAEYMDKAKKYLRNIFGINEKGNLFGIGDVQVNDIRCYPVSAVTRELLYESRDVFTYSEKLENNPTEYEPIELNDLWAHKVQSPPVVFGMKRQHTKIKETSKICACNECNGMRMVNCECGGKKTTCAKCNGKGQTVCNTCKGAGRYKCGYCRGKGYTEEYTSYSGNDYARPIRKTCIECNGAGIVSCYSCYSNEESISTGMVQCYSCFGIGFSVCLKCAGRGLLECGHCDGKGKIRIGKGIEQTFGADSVSINVNKYQINENIYGNRSFGEPKFDASKYKLIFSDISDGFMAAVPYYDESPEFTLVYTITFLNMYEMVKKYYNTSLDKNEIRLVKYGSRFYQKEIMEIKFQYKGKIHYCQIDEAEGSYILDKTLEM